ncbi:endonuclease/exonuclease/phosphatase family protein [Undibacterium fentianense]|uniref:Endonuclease/exonuclease/phosphatase family protein n=1 Tax=Undibacterium fentianense TaxID=2828728 RepID=A0A941E1Q6_9BURK|nr:endonuclease/exonuclease/phosphatase family protein [Undibacterium fentianense]MBR7799642.1 endonuclease/exonuclease/phosphatase family protein [Undibacterium fentianense]
MKLRIATYNIHKGVSAFGRKARIHELKAAIKLLNADLIFLQEVQGQHDYHAKKHLDWPEQSQHEFLAGESHAFAYGMNAIYEHGHHGNALLSRLPILQASNHDVSDHAYEQRGILHVQVQLGEVEAHCFVIHLGLFAASRRRQIQALIQQIQEQVDPKHPLIIAGDFNDWSQRLSHTLYKELGVIEAFDISHHNQTEIPTQRSAIHMVRHLFQARPTHARTFPAGLPWLSLDRVYLRGFHVEQAQVLNGKPWSQLSDHVPICVDLRLNHLQIHHG